MLKATEQPVDPGTGTAPVKAFLDTLGGQSAPRATARRHRRRCVQRPQTDDRCRRSLVDEKLGLAGIARRLGIGRASVYRVLGKPVTGVTNGDGNADQG